METKFYLIYMSHTSPHTTHCVVGWGVRSYPPSIPEHNFFIFGHFGSAYPKTFSHLFGLKTLGKIMKFHGDNPRSFLLINV